MAVQWHFVIPWPHSAYYCDWCVVMLEYFFYLLYNCHKPAVCITFYVGNDDKMTDSDHNSFTTKILGKACSGWFLQVLSNWNCIWLSTRVWRKDDKATKYSPRRKTLKVIPLHLLVMGILLLIGDMSGRDEGVWEKKGFWMMWCGEVIILLNCCYFRELTTSDGRDQVLAINQRVRGFRPCKDRSGNNVGHYSQRQERAWVSSVNCIVWFC